MTRCPVNGKWIYRTRRKAIRALDQIRSQRDGRGLEHRQERSYYRCPHCGFYHLSHLEREKSWTAA